MRQRGIKKPDASFVRKLNLDARDSSQSEDQQATETVVNRNREQAESKRPGCCRRCLNIMKYVLLFLLVPPFLNFASLTKEGQQLKPASGELYDIGNGQKMFLSCMGTGVPTVILDSPTGMTSDVWVLVQPELAKLTTVCVYDRAGLGFSDRPYKNYSQADGEESGEPEEMEIGNWRDRWQEFTVERMADDLQQLVTVSSQQKTPLLLVGSELGGLVARFYAHMNERNVSGVVLIDPLVEDIFTHDSGIWSQFWFGHLTPSFQSLQLAAAVGLTRLAILFGLMEQPITGENIPDDIIMRQKYLLCHPRHLSSVVDEHHFINQTFSQMALAWKLKQFPSHIPVTVITGNYYDEQLPSVLNKAWAKSQQHLISKLHPRCNHIVVNGADHHMMYRNHMAVVEPIRRLVKQWRTKQKKM